MNIIFGGSGQVGSYVVKQIKRMRLPVRAVVRDPSKIIVEGVETRVADMFDAEALTSAMMGCECAFLITPENPSSKDIIGETRQIVDNYRTAIQASGIEKIIGISCVGAQLDADTGNIQMSRILESLADLPITSVFIRPSYYYSNWLAYLDVINSNGIMPTFFPEDFNLEMNSPLDVAVLAAKHLTDGNMDGRKTIVEVAGPRQYSSRDVADIFSKLLRKNVNAQSIPPGQWMKALTLAGFTPNTATNMDAMTRAVIDHVAVAEHPLDVVKLSTELPQFLAARLSERKAIALPAGAVL